jgi:hypothetical protein
MAEVQSKKWKATQGVGCLTTITGLVLIAKSAADISGGSQNLAEIVFLAGIGVIVIGYLGSWWNHG